MKKKKIITNLGIEDIAAEGKGIARHEGKVIFVDAGVPGDVVDVRLYKNKKDYALARPVKLHTPSPLRTDAFCKHFEACGGCKWQHLRYDQQLKYKQKVVTDAFKHIGKTEVPEILPIIGSPKTTFYRNKMEFTFSNKRWLTSKEVQAKEEIDNRDALGFHISGAFDKVLDIDECWLQEDPSNAIRNSLRDFARKERISFFDLREREGMMRNLLIRKTTTGDLMVIVIVHEKDDAAIEKIMRHLEGQFPEITSLQYIINPKKNDAFYDLEVVPYSGKDHIIETLGNLSFKIGPKSFFQTNSYQAENLYKLALDFAELSGKETVYDLYSGTGTIANYIAGHCGHVVGIEQIPEAIHDSLANAGINGITNVTFHCGDMRDVLVPGFLESNGLPDVIITDPPRAGMHPDVIDVILKAAPKTVVYVSCNPATQARDTQMLEEKYRLQKIQPVDMFPHTYHVENVAQLKLK